MEVLQGFFSPLGANPTKWLNTLKQFVGKLPTNCLSVFDHFVGLALKGLTFLPFNERIKLFACHSSFIFRLNVCRAYSRPLLVATIAPNLVP